MASEKKRNRRKYIANLQPNSDWLNARIAELGLTKKEIGQAFGAAGLTITRIVNGERQVRPDEIFPLADVLQVDAAELLTQLGYKSSTHAAFADGRINSRGDILTDKTPLPPTVQTPNYYPSGFVYVVDDRDGPLAAFHNAAVCGLTRPNVPLWAVGRLVVAEIVGRERRTLGTLTRGEGPRDVEIVAFGSNLVIDATDLASASPVLQIVFPR